MNEAETAAPEKKPRGLGVSRIKVRGEKVELCPLKIDKILIAVHNTPKMSYTAIAALVQTPAPGTLFILRHMRKTGMLFETLLKGPGVTSKIHDQWTLTPQGARQAVFALHRARCNRTRTVFVDGVNPWTGAVSRKKRVN